MLMFSHMKNLLSIVFPCCTYMYVSSVMRCLVPLDSTYASPGPQTKWKKYYNGNVIRLFPYCTMIDEQHVVESDSFGVKSILKCLRGLEAYNKMFMSSVDQCILI